MLFKSNYYIVEKYWNYS